MASKVNKIPLELLAPAKNADIAFAAILAGADAVYIGPDSHGARKNAANSIAEIARVVEVAHQFNAKVYATVNTLVYDDEIPSVEKLIADLYRVGVDALIVQDLGILRMKIPPIELHASTQCDIRTPEKAKFLASVGFSRLVLARELSLDEIRAIHEAVPDTPLEAFIHGALCVSYSGDCRASFMAGGRSANRGECAQICRLPYDLVDENGRVIVRDRHLLSLRDLNRTPDIQAMADAGVSSFKIEGRLKEIDYVRNAVAWYSRVLDKFVADSHGRYVRQSFGHSRLGFTPVIEKAFNRGFTSYFLTGRAPAKGMASMLTPKATGPQVGTVTSCNGRVITAKLSAQLANGDGLGFFDRDRKFCGFRLNRVEGSKLFPATEVNIPAGTPIYRNRDKQWDDRMAATKGTRTVRVDMVLRTAGESTLVLDLTDERGCSVSETLRLEKLDDAVTPQEHPRRNILSKLGGTIYQAGKIVDLAGQKFVPASALADLRRSAIALLSNAWQMTYPRTLRLPEDIHAPLPQGTVLTIHDNVANHLAEEFYRDHGATQIALAVEKSRPEGETQVMTTRYCIRKEMGKCLLTPSGRDWPSPLYLQSGNLRMRVEFDCKRCGMNLFM